MCKCINRYIIALIFYFVCCCVQWRVGQKAFMCLWTLNVLSTMDGWILQGCFFFFFYLDWSYSKKCIWVQKKFELLLLCDENTTKLEQCLSKIPHSHIHDLKHINRVKNAQLFTLNKWMLKIMNIFYKCSDLPCHQPQLVPACVNCCWSARGRHNATSHNSCVASKRKGQGGLEEEYFQDSINSSAETLKTYHILSKNKTMEETMSAVRLR